MDCPCWFKLTLERRFERKKKKRERFQVETCWVVVAALSVSTLRKNVSPSSSSSIARVFFCFVLKLMDGLFLFFGVDDLIESNRACSIFSRHERIKIFIQTGHGEKEEKKQNSVKSRRSVSVLNETVASVVKRYERLLLRLVCIRRLVRDWINDSAESSRDKERED